MVVATEMAAVEAAGEVAAAMEGVAETEAATVTVAAMAMVIRAARETITASRQAPETLRKPRPMSTTRRMQVAVL
ncbi:hypothetical protein SZ54_4971 [Rhizobium sp. UR51a]|nr:hypothetical protein SZ54_4971 [Rhizobium sp. UR51a]